MFTHDGVVNVYGNDNGKAKEVEINWMYPEIYGKEKSSLFIELSHTRAADGLKIQYDSERDGWVIYQASVFEWESDDKICDQDWQEVAFIGAWAREKHD